MREGGERAVVDAAEADAGVVFCRVVAGLRGALAWPSGRG